MMAHRRTRGRVREYSEVQHNFASLVFGDSKKAPEYERAFLELFPRNFYACTKNTSVVWQGVLKGTDVLRPGTFERIGEHAPPANGG